MKKVCRNIITIMYALVIGGIIGFFTWLFLLLVYLGIHLFWDEFILKLNKSFILIACIIGGILVGICEKYIGKYPKSMNLVLKEYKENKSVEYKSLPKSLIKTFIILWFGGTVGPEAALSGMIGGLATLSGEFLKYGVKRVENNVAISSLSTTKLIFSGPLYGFYSFVNKDDLEKIKIIKKIVYGITIFSGIIIFFIFERIDDKVSFITKFTNIVVGRRELIFIVPLFVVGILMVMYTKFLDGFVERVFKPLQKYNLIKGIIGGIVLGGLAILLPYILFSGEHTLKSLIVQSSSLGPKILIAIALIKLFSNKVCANTGWIGGPIFPLMFSGAAIGMAISYLVGINLAFSACIVMSTLLAGVMKNYKLTIVLLILFFKIKLWIFIIVTAVLSDFIFKNVIKI